MKFLRNFITKINVSVVLTSIDRLVRMLLEFFNFDLSSMLNIFDNLLLEFVKSHS